jgi:mono/diheme cytochrome c family protein
MLDFMKRAVLLLPLALAGATQVIAAKKPSTANQPPQKLPAASAPAKSADADKIAKGKELYTKHQCKTCHGDNLQGGIGNALVGEKSEDIISQKYIEEFVGQVLAHKTNLPELAKVQEKFNSGDYKNRKKPLTMVMTMGATLSTTSVNNDDLPAIATYIMSERSKQSKK